MVSVMPSMDEQIGRNLVKLRGEMSQRDLADAMKARGWKWSHVTVGAVERGERPLRLSESEDIKRILGSQFPLTMADSDTVLAVWNGEMSQAHDDLEKAVEHYVDTQVQLQAAGDRAESPRLREVLTAWLDVSPEQVVRNVLRRMELQNDVESRLYELEQLDVEGSNG